MSDSRFDSCIAITYKHNHLAFHDQAQYIRFTISIDVGDRQPAKRNPHVCALGWLKRAATVAQKNVQSCRLRACDKQIRIPIVVEIGVATRCPETLKLTGALKAPSPLPSSGLPEAAMSSLPSRLKSASTSGVLP